MLLLFRLFGLLQIWDVEVLVGIVWERRALVATLAAHTAQATETRTPVVLAMRTKVHMQSTPLFSLQVIAVTWDPSGVFFASASLDATVQATDTIMSRTLVLPAPSVVQSANATLSCAILRVPEQSAEARQS
jgi:hypothetical protein